MAKYQLRCDEDLWPEIISVKFVFVQNIRKSSEKQTNFFPLISFIAIP